jgi:hypothetical protein
VRFGKMGDAEREQVAVSAENTPLLQSSAAQSGAFSPDAPESDQDLAKVVAA